MDPFATATEMLDHFLTAFKHRQAIAHLTGLADLPDFANALAQGAPNG